MQNNDTPVITQTVLKADPEPHIVIRRADGSPVTNPDTIEFMNDFNALPVPVRRAVKDALKAVHQAREQGEEDEPAFTAGIFADTLRAAGLHDHAAHIEATFHAASVTAPVTEGDTL